MTKPCTVTHLCFVSHKRDIGKQNRPKLDLSIFFIRSIFFIKPELNVLSSVRYKGNRLILTLSYTLKLLSALCGNSVEYGI